MLEERERNDEEEDVCEEGEEEEELQEDPVIEPEVTSVLKKKQKYAPPPSEPVRRIATKTKAETEEVLFVGTSRSPEARELEEIRSKIEALRLTPDPYDDRCTFSCV